MAKGVLLFIGLTFFVNAWAHDTVGFFNGTRTRRGAHKKARILAGQVGFFNGTRTRRGAHKKARILAGQAAEATNQEVNLYHSQDGSAEAAEATNQDVNLHHSQAAEATNQEVNLHHSQDGSAEALEATNQEVNLHHSQDGSAEAPEATNQEVNLHHSQDGPAEAMSVSAGGRVEDYLKKTKTTEDSLDPDGIKALSPDETSAQTVVNATSVLEEISHASQNHASWTAEEKTKTHVVGNHAELSGTSGKAAEATNQVNLHSQDRSAEVTGPSTTGSCAAPQIKWITKDGWQGFKVITTDNTDNGPSLSWNTSSGADLYVNGRNKGACGTVSDCMKKLQKSLQRICNFQANFGEVIRSLGSVPTQDLGASAAGKAFVDYMKQADPYEVACAEPGIVFLLDGIDDDLMIIGVSFLIVDQRHRIKWGATDDAPLHADETECGLPGAKNMEDCMAILKDNFQKTCPKTPPNTFASLEERVRSVLQQDRFHEQEALLKSLSGYWLFSYLKAARSSTIASCTHPHIQWWKDEQLRGFQVITTDSTDNTDKSTNLSWQTTSGTDLYVNGEACGATVSDCMKKLQGSLQEVCEFQENVGEVMRSLLRLKLPEDLEKSAAGIAFVDYVKKAACAEPEIQFIYNNAAFDLILGLNFAFVNQNHAIEWGATDDALLRVEKQECGLPGAENLKDCMGILENKIKETCPETTSKTFASLKEGVRSVLRRQERFEREALLKSPAGKRLFGYFNKDLNASAAGNMFVDYMKEATCAEPGFQFMYDKIGGDWGILGLSFLIVDQRHQIKWGAAPDADLLVDGEKCGPPPDAGNMKDCMTNLTGIILKTCPEMTDEQFESLKARVRSALQEDRFEREALLKSLSGYWLFSYFTKAAAAAQVPPSAGDVEQDVKLSATAGRPSAEYRGGAVEHNAEAAAAAQVPPSAGDVEQDVELSATAGRPSAEYRGGAVEHNAEVASSSTIGNCSDLDIDDIWWTRTSQRVSLGGINGFQVFINRNDVHEFYWDEEYMHVDGVKCGRFDPFTKIWHGFDQCMETTLKTRLENTCPQSGAFVAVKKLLRLKLTPDLSISVIGKLLTKYILQEVDLCPKLQAAFAPGEAKFKRIITVWEQQQLWGLRVRWFSPGGSIQALIYDSQRGEWVNNGQEDPCGAGAADSCMRKLEGGIRERCGWGNYEKVMQEGNLKKATTGTCKFTKKCDKKRNANCDGGQCKCKDDWRAFDVSDTVCVYVGDISYH